MLRGRAPSPCKFFRSSLRCPPGPNRRIASAGAFSKAWEWLPPNRATRIRWGPVAANAAAGMTARAVRLVMSSRLSQVS